MGLDISVCKLKKKENEINESDNFFRMVNDNYDFSDRNFPQWTKKFFTSYKQEMYDWEKYKEQTGIDVPAMVWCSTEYGEKCIMTLESNDEEKKRIEIDLDEVPTYFKDIQIVPYEEVGYQRKGLNSKFYEDYDNGKIGYFVWSKKELERYKEEYCDEKSPYGDDYESPKTNFQHNIIDKFTEGEDCVIFDW